MKRHRHSQAAAAIAAAAASLSAAQQPYLTTTISPSNQTIGQIAGSCAVSGDRVILGGGHTPPIQGSATIVRLGESGEWFVETVLQSPGSLSLPNFGQSVDVDGDFAVVGAPGFFLPSQPDAKGRVFVFRRDAGQWTLEAQLGTAIGGVWEFGSQVSLDGAILAVSDGGDGTTASSRVHVFERAADQTWPRVASFAGNPGPPAWVRVDANSLALAVGAVSGSSASKIQMYRRSDGTWLPDGVVESPSASNGLYPKVALSGDVIVAKQYNANLLVYERLGPGTWQLSAELPPPSRPSNRLWGSELALDGPDLIVGNWNSAGQLPTGLRFRRLAYGEWEPLGPFGNPGLCTSSALFYGAIDIEGDRVLVTSPSGCGGYGIAEGYAHVFDLTPADCEPDGVVDAGSDGDGAADCSDSDDDNDGITDSIDGCPFDPLKTSPGQCGCGIPEADTDGDGVCDSVDNCPLHPNPSQADCDGDGIGDVCVIAAGVPDANGNGIPDPCDLAACPGDLTADRVVNGADLAVLLGFWGPVGTFPAADIDDSGTVDAGDLAILLGGWGPC